MFTAQTWVLLEKDLIDLFAKVEDGTVAIQTNELSKDMASGINAWKKAKIDNLNNFNKNLNTGIKSLFREVEKETGELIRKAVEVVDEEMLETLRITTGKDDIEVKGDSKFIARTIDKEIDEETKEVNLLLKHVRAKQKNMINTIASEAKSLVASFTMADKTIVERKIYGDKIKLELETKSLFNAIKKHTELNAVRGTPVIYKSGHVVSFRSYMEMRIRTDVQQIALERTEMGTNALGIYLFLASEHTDCADDHVNYQGKVYVSDNAPEDLLKKYPKLSRAKEEGFLTRPNCRHYVLPITREQAENLKETKAMLKTKKGSYAKENYDDLQAQRYNERNIRHYKARGRNAEIMRKNATTDEERAICDTDIAKYNAKVKEWQAKQRELLENNPTLKREYQRESYKRMAYDLGVNIQRKLNKEVDNSSNDDYNRNDDIFKMMPNKEKAYIEDKKAIEYILNKEHKSGGPKAKLLESLLGYNLDNKEKFINDVQKAVKKPLFEEFKGFTKNGYKYISYFELKGPNGKTALMTSSWELTSLDSEPRLITTFAKNENEEIKLRAKIKKKIEERENQ